MQEQSQEFEQLRQLLALKRHENPPPGYFRDFSTRVIIAIETGSQRTESGWFRRLTAVLQARPAISTSFGLATCLVLVAASSSFVGNEPSAGPGVPRVEPGFTSVSERPIPASAGTLFFTNHAELAYEVPPLTVVTSSPAYASPSDSLFDYPLYRRVETLPASFETTTPRK